MDLNEGEKALFKLWNGHLHKYPCYGDDMMIPILEKFIDAFGPQIHRRSLYKNFLLHLSNFHEFGILSSSMVLKMTTRLQIIIKDMFDHPESYPETPEKLPIENPYYVPKPIPISESLNLHLSEDDEEDLNSKKNSTAKTKIVFKEKAPTRNFWLKKSFRNPVASSLDSEAGDDCKVWPRKKAVVTFANEVFVDEIRDQNDTSKSQQQYDVNDIFKLTTWISPRQRRGKS